MPAARRRPSPQAQAAAARARRSKVLARRRRTTTMLFLAFTLGAIVAAVGGLAFLWAPGVPAVMLSVYIAYLRSQERRRFTYQMDRRRAELAAQRLRDRQRQPGQAHRRRPGGRRAGGRTRAGDRPRPVGPRGRPARTRRADRSRRVGRPAARAAAAPRAGRQLGTGAGAPADLRDRTGRTPGHQRCRPRGPRHLELGTLEHRHPGPGGRGRPPRTPASRSPAPRRGRTAVSAPTHAGRPPRGGHGSAAARRCSTSTRTGTGRGPPTSSPRTRR